MENITDINIQEYSNLSSPLEVKSLFSINPKIQETISQTRNQIKQILSGESNKKIFIIGPCSIHNPDEALEYAEKLSSLSEKVKDKILILMRTYFEKPRTTIGWKGLINDPDLNNSFNIEKGIKQARKLLLDINSFLPCATEFLDPNTPQYLDDLISWAAIGARTTESQTHREMASGLSMPVGFKNATSGNTEIAINAIKSTKNPHNFLGIDNNGKISNIKTKGNPYAHLILRGGKNPNYSSEDINQAQEKLKSQNLFQGLIVDCSHGNSNKNPENQSKVLEEIIKQINSGNKNIIGIMIESNLFSGNQKLSKDLKKGISITDACIGFQETEEIILKAHSNLSS